MNGKESLQTEPTQPELERPIWIVAHSTPEAWKKEIQGVLDPRHPTRHNIWTSVADYLQERVFDIGPHLRLDAGKIYFRNAFACAIRKLNFEDDSVKERGAQIAEQLKKFKPPVVITLGDHAYRFLCKANTPDQPVLRHNLKIESLGQRFRDTLQRFDSRGVNVFPLLHASVARKSWHTAGEKYGGSGHDDSQNYFRYVGYKLGDVLLSHGRDWPIWRDEPDRA